jgi:hypothetical protein
MRLQTSDILKILKATADNLHWDGENIEILLIGGAAGMLTGQLSAHRVTQDCDVMNFRPQEAQNAVLDAAEQTAKTEGLPEQWLSTQAMDTLVILPNGWHARRIHIETFGKLSIYAVSRLDLLAMKFYANRPQDRQDIIEMKPSPEEIEYVRKYLDMLRVPSRQADLDQVVSAFKLVDAIEDMFYGGR